MKPTDLSIYKIDNQSFLFSTLWKDKTILITWLRHYGGIFCREQAARITSIYPTLVEQNIQVCAIGNGTSLMAKDFVEQFNIPFPVYTDPERKTYELMEFERGVSIRWSMIKGAYQAYKKGHRQDGVQGDPWQLGGEALIDTQGTILWSHHAKNAEDHASTEMILEAVQKYGKR